MTAAGLAAHILSFAVEYSALVGNMSRRHRRRRAIGGKKAGPEFALSIDMPFTADTFLQRMVGAAVLDRSTYEELEADRSATVQALFAVVLSSAATGIGIAGSGNTQIRTMVSAGAVALIAYTVWAFLSFEVGVRVFPEAHTRGNGGGFLRALGFASAPACLRILGVFPSLTNLVFGVTAIWALAAMMMAVQQTLNYESSLRAAVVCAVGLILAVALAAGLSAWV